MEPTAYLQLIEKFFPGLVLRIVETINGTNSPRTYLFREFLQKQYSLDGRWESITVNGAVIAADYVAVNSPLPLKRRPSLSTASGKIPKSGLEMHLDEEQMDKIDTLIALARPQTLIAAQLLEYLPTVILAVYEKIEETFLLGLSTGVGLIEDDKNVGLGIRLDYKYRTDHKFGVGTLWSNPASRPFDDLKRIQDKASSEGKKITQWMLTPNVLYNLCNTQQAKELYAFGLNFVGQNVPTPDLAMINRMAQARYGYTFREVDRTITYQRNGVDTSYKPWNESSVVGLSTNRVGELVWKEVAEKNRPVAGVTYQSPEDFLLVSQFRINRPTLSEVVNSQAKVVPVISAINDIYLLDVDTIQA